MRQTGTPGNNPRAFPCIGRKRSRPRPPCAIKKIRCLATRPPRGRNPGGPSVGNGPPSNGWPAQRSNVSSAAAVIRMGGKVRRRRRDGGARLRACTGTSTSRPATCASQKTLLTEQNMNSYSNPELNAVGPDLKGAATEWMSSTAKCIICRCCEEYGVCGDAAQCKPPCPRRQSLLGQRHCQYATPQ